MVAESDRAGGTGAVPALDPASGEAGLDRLYHRYSGMVRRYIERQFGSGPPDPDDVVQTAFERYVRLSGHGEVRSPGAFLKRTAVNLVLDHRRAEKVRADYAVDRRALEPPQRAVDTEHVLETRERLAIIENAILAMDEQRRTILVMSRIHGLSAAEIARRTGCSATLVKIRLGEAVALCQQAIDMRESMP